jgi:hypothetical protein
LRDYQAPSASGDVEQTPEAIRHHLEEPIVIIKWSAPLFEWVRGNDRERSRPLGHYGVS